MTTREQTNLFQSIRNSASLICTEPDKLVKDLTDLVTEKYKAGDSFASSVWPTMKKEFIDEIERDLEAGKDEFVFRNHTYKFVEE